MLYEEKHTSSHCLKSKKVGPGRRMKNRSAVTKDRGHDGELKKNMERIMRSTEHLRELSARLLNAQEEERRRLAHEVHENLAQTMMAVQFRVETALSEMTDNANTKSQEILEPITSILQEGMDSIRRIAGRLRPLILDDLGILVTVSRYCREIAREHPGLVIEKRLEIEEREIPDPLKVVIYRILESAMCSILKHKPSGLVEIRLGRNGTLISLTIRAHEEALGFEQYLSEGDIHGWSDSATIGERAMLSGGALTIAANHEGGTTLSVEWPIEKEPRVP